MSANSADLSGRIFLITGANTGIGRATADDLARRGGNVYVACRSVQKGRARLDGWELRKSQEARLKRLSDRSQVLSDVVIVPVSATADVSLPQALLRLLREIAPAESVRSPE